MADLYFDEHCTGLLSIHDQLQLHRMSAVWCRPHSRDDEFLYLPGLDELEGFIWLVTDGGAASQAISDLKRAFSHWRIRRNDVCDLADVFIEGRKYYSDIARLTTESRTALVPLLASWEFGIAASVFFTLPHCLHAVRAISQPLEDLWRLRRASEVLDERLELSGHLEQHIGRVVEAGGMTVITVRDSDMKKMFLLTGDHQRVIEWFEHMRSKIGPAEPQIVGVETFATWCAVGLSATCLA